MNNIGSVPDLGALSRRVRSGSQLTAMVRRLDADGTFEAQLIQTAQGQMAAPNRVDLVDAEELVEMMRRMVREELAEFFAQAVVATRGSD